LGLITELTGETTEGLVDEEPVHVIGIFFPARILSSQAAHSA
jgi:hypothetical protein